MDILQLVLLALLLLSVLIVWYLVRRKVPKVVYFLLALELALCVCLGLGLVLAQTPQAQAVPAEKTRHVMLEGLYPPITAEEAANEAYVIVYGQIDGPAQIREITDYQEDGTHPVSECYTMRIIRILDAVKDERANASAAALLLLPGGETETDLYIADYAPSVQNGDFVVAFLRQDGNPIRPQYVFVEQDGKVYAPTDASGDTWDFVKTDAFLEHIKTMLK